MKTKLKKAFQLNATYFDLQLASAKIRASLMIINASKLDFIQGIRERDNEINKILLDEFDYLVSPADSVIYNDQLNKILVYEGTWQHDGDEESYKGV